MRSRIAASVEFLREDARSWGAPGGAAVVLFLVPLVGTLLVGASRAHLPTFQLITDEDRVLEWLQVVGYGAAAVLAVLLARRLLGLSESRYAFAYLLFAVGCVFIVGEEISWGQRILGIETPKELEELNRQGEVGIHNIYKVETMFQLVLLVAGAYGSIGVCIIRSKRERLRPRMLALLVPPIFLSSCFLVLFLHRLARFTIPNVTEITAFVKIGEWPELCFAAALAVFCGLNLRVLKAE